MPASNPKSPNPQSRTASTFVEDTPPEPPDELSLLDEINDTIKTSASILKRLGHIYPAVDFNSGKPVVLPTARHSDPFRSPDEWKIKTSPHGGRIKRDEMRSLALYASANLEAQLLDFVASNSIVLSRFSLVTSESLRPRIAQILGGRGQILGGNDHVNDRQGGLALLQARVVLESVGAAVIFQDPGEAALAADFASTFRLLNVNDIPTATNRSSADAMATQLKTMTCDREPELIPSFFVTLQSPAVPAYKAQQEALIEQLKCKDKCKPAAGKANPSSKLTFAAIVEGNADEENASLAPLRNEASLNAATPASIKDQLKKRHETKGLGELSERSRRSSVGGDGGDAFESLLERDSMRCLALISHNNMKEEMRKFVIGHKDILRCFRLTGTASTMKMLSEILESEDLGGFSCTSGPLGGDAQVGAFICLEQIGGVIFFTDPLSAHPHQADVDFLHRVINQHHVLHATNPSGAHVMINVMRQAVVEGRQALIPSFFSTINAKTLINDVSVAIKMQKWRKRASYKVTQRRVSHDEELESATVKARTTQLLKGAAASDTVRLLATSAACLAVGMLLQRRLARR